MWVLLRPCCRFFPLKYFSSPASSESLQVHIYVLIHFYSNFRAGIRPCHLSSFESPRSEFPVLFDRYEKPFRCGAREARRGPTSPGAAHTFLRRPHPSQERGVPQDALPIPIGGASPRGRGPRRYIRAGGGANSATAHAVRSGRFAPGAAPPPSGPRGPSARPLDPHRHLPKVRCDRTGAGGQTVWPVAIWWGGREGCFGKGQPQDCMESFWGEASGRWLRASVSPPRGCCINRDVSAWRTFCYRTSNEWVYR